MSDRRRSRPLDPNDEGQARAYMLRLIKFRERSELELRAKLAQKGFTPQVEEAVLMYAKRSRLVDDALFARLWVTGRIKRPFGVRRLRWELRRKGIAPSLIEEALSVATQGVREVDAVRDLVRSRSARMSGVPARKVKERLFRALTQRGFSHDVIMEVLREEVPDYETSDDA